MKLIFAAADSKNHAKITQICHSGGCNNMEMLMFWVPKLDYFFNGRFAASIFQYMLDLVAAPFPVPDLRCSL